jgi:hypothetical protein
MNGLVAGVNVLTSVRNKLTGKGAVGVEEDKFRFEWKGNGQI